MQVTDILLGYIDIGVMMQKPSSGRERDLKEHYKVYRELSAKLGS